jgi:hypothetical protein
MWTTPLSREWAGLFLRHGLLEASPTNTSDSFYLSKVYFKSTRVTFKRIFFFDVFPNYLQVQTRLVISKAGSKEPFSFVPFDPKKEPSSEDGNFNFKVWTFENPMISDVLNMLFSFYWEFDNVCFIFPLDSIKYSFLEFPLERKLKRSWMDLSNTCVSPSLIEPECVSTVFDNEDPPQESSEYKVSRFEAHDQFNVHIYGTSSSLSSDWANSPTKV